MNYICIVLAKYNNIMIVGRENEVQQFNDILELNKSSFVAVYGRRRVGKTYLIREHFNNKFNFYVSGIAKGNMSRQLSNFHEALLESGSSDQELPIDWFEAFGQLKKLIIKSKAKKKVIFIDEMPWMDTPRSEFISALENFWNQWASARKDILLIACGSATAWMIKKIINNTDGLHNRITHQMHIQPFTLRETELFLKSLNIKWTRYQIIQTYMILGGIPFYLEKLNPRYSSIQNIDKLLFAPNGSLKNEFENLFKSLFKNTEKYLKVIEALSKLQRAMYRNEIATSAKISNGGGLTDVLDELILCDFIIKTIPFNGNANNAVYQIRDHFILFNYRFLKGKQSTKSGQWIKQIDSGAYRQWAGTAYEKVCYNHTNQILKSLEISGMETSEYSWRDKKVKPTTQIDFIIDRKDGAVNLCEVKFTEAAFAIDKNYAQNLRNKVYTFKSQTKTNKAIFLTMITTYPLKSNQYSDELVVNTLTMDDLFHNF
jgi:uncharacterized protein